VSQLSSALPAFAQALQQETEKLNELVTVEILAAVAGKGAADAYLQQVSAVKQATAVYQQAAAAAKGLEEGQKKALAAQQKVGQAIGGAAAAFGRAAQFTQGLIATGDPNAWATLQDSVKLVAMQVAQFFLPAIIKGAYYAQQFADWLHNLSPETRATITSFATLAAQGYALGKALQLANTATLGLGPKAFGALPGPVQAATGALAVFAAAAGYAAYKAREISNSFASWAKRSNDAIESITRADVEGSEVYRKMKGAGNKDEAKRINDREYRSTEEQLRSAQKELGDLMGGSRAGKILNEDRIKELQESIAELAKKQRIADISRNELILGERFVPSDKAGVGARVGLAGEQANKMAQLLYHMPKEMQPRFSAIEEARKQFQLNALKDPLEQKMLQYQRDAAEALQKQIPEILRQIEKKTGNGLA
jgi:hypothetical protein